MALPPILKTGLSGIDAEAEAGPFGVDAPDGFLRRCLKTPAIDDDLL